MIEPKSNENTFPTNLNKPCYVSSYWNLGSGPHNFQWFFLLHSVIWKSIWQPCGGWIRFAINLKS